MKVLICGNTSELPVRKLLDIFPGVWTVLSVSPEELYTHIGDADVLIPEHTMVDESTLARAENLKLIQTGPGYENVPLYYCRDMGIYVANAPGINSAAVAEQVRGLVICWLGFGNTGREVARKCAELSV
ncbi:MAG: hypothetical protein DRP87_17160 [Spirochaetes bacterium]|nr:MAG: hypothetical protein DRP87_17160 [Spirochaetota bacterium]